MIGRRLVPPTSSKGSKNMQNNSKQVKAVEKRMQHKEAEMNQESWSPSSSPTPSWSELSLYWSEGSVSSRSHFLELSSLSYFHSSWLFWPTHTHTHINSVLHTRAHKNIYLWLSTRFCNQTVFGLHPLLLPALPHPLQQQGRHLHICEIVKVFYDELETYHSGIF